MYDKDLEYLLEVIGHTLASHIMCRAQISGGTGRNEEPLTADIRDLFDQFDVCADYLACVGSKSKMAITVTDLNRAQESKVGADFVVAMKGLDAGPAGGRTSWKVAGVQAKRLDYVANPLAYARSKNHHSQANKMAATYGAGSSFFAFYHDEQVLPLAGTAGMTAFPPPTYYVMPTRGPTMFYCQHPDMTKVKQAFIEPSAYRRRRAMQLAVPVLTQRYAWGIAVAGISTVTMGPANALPPVATVLAASHSFPEFLVGLADCTVGDRLDDAAYADALRALRQLDPDDPDTPNFLVEIAFSPGQRDFG